MAPLLPVPTRELEQFVTVVRRLRRECPWDRKQTHASLRAGLIEETFEAAEAITHRRFDHLREELGDILLHVVLQSTIAEETGRFTLRDVVDTATDKMIRRHPHVFGSSAARTEQEVLQAWNDIKMREGRRSLLDGVPASLPALMRAQRLQMRASKVGFDWKHPEEVWKKVREELEELRRTLRRGTKRRREEEFGDFLFALVNYARFLTIDPEHALTRANSKFLRRFRAIEKELKRRGQDIHSATLAEMDAIWNASKKKKRT